MFQIMRECNYIIRYFFQCNTDNYQSIDRIFTLYTRLPMGLQKSLSDLLQSGCMYFLSYCIVGKIPEMITDDTNPNPDSNRPSPNRQQGIFPHEITAIYFRFSSVG